MDEPFAALDPLMREQLQGELLRLKETFHKTIVFVTHDVEEAFRIADKIAVVRDGKLLQYGTGAELLRAPANDFVASFIARQRVRAALLPERVMDVMSREPCCLPPSGRVEEALKLMEREGVDTVLVTDEDGRLKGCVGAWQLVQRDYRGHTVDELMEDDVASADPKEAAISAFARLEERKRPYLAVVEDRRLVGIVTRRSLAKALAKAVWGGVAP